MQKLNKQIIKLVTKYPFLTDPIVLFNPSRIPSQKEILSWELNLVYPEIDKNIKIIDEIKKDFFKITDLLIKVKFDSLYLEVEVSERLKDFHKIIRIIEIFYDKKEYEKYNLINEYFWIDFELLEEIFERREVLENHFSIKEGILKRKEISKLEQTLVGADEIKFYFDEALKFLDLENNWKVLTWDVISIVHTNFNKKGGEIMIPKNIEIDAKRLLGLIAHEIDGHCVQFTNCDCLAGGTIRYSKSESLVEWYAIYIEYQFESKVFWNNLKVLSLIDRNYIRFDTINTRWSVVKYLSCLKWNWIRFFRWFSDIAHYKNLKDFVYIQWLYKIIKFGKKYSNTLSLLKSWAINKSYIKKFWIKEWRKEKINIKKTSAYYVLEKYFSK